MIHAISKGRETLHVPAQQNSFCGWVTCYDFPDGTAGLSYTETHPGRDPGYQVPRIEFCEAVSAPVSYGSVECGDPNMVTERVYLTSRDGGRTYLESGRCPGEDGGYLVIGRPDGAMTGLLIPRRNDSGTAWGDYISVRESLDGGSTWHETDRLCTGVMAYLWRARRLRDGSVIVLTSLQGSPWGPGHLRVTRTTELPGETYINKLQTCFLHTVDGIHFSGPHYVLPGTGAHEYDCAELSDGTLLFVAGDVQGTLTARQEVRRQGSTFLNGSLMPIRLGAPEDPMKNPQGGYVPESIVCLGNDLLIGARRNQPFTCSMDRGENWFPIEGLPTGLYQPVIERDGRTGIRCFGHVGGDNAAGQVENSIRVDRFCVDGMPPAGCTIRLERCLNAAGDQFINRFRASVSYGDKPLTGIKLRFRFNPFWTADGAVSTMPQKDAPIQIDAVTDAEGSACAAVPAYDEVRDIHFAYHVDAVLVPEDDSLLPAESPLIMALAMAPKRSCPYPYDAYYAEGILFISPRISEQFPDVYEQLTPLVGGLSADGISDALREALLKAGVLSTDGRSFLKSTHGRVLAGVSSMGSGDQYC